MSLIRRKMACRVSTALFYFCCLLLSCASGRELPESPTAFITAALCSRTGDVWVASEGGGLWKLPHDFNQWQQQKGKGLPETDNFLSLAEDLQGRIWVGTDTRGAAVWNGESWAPYDQKNALLGERVNALAVSPFNGDVALATSGGLSIYSPATETWMDFTRAQGLPEDQIVSLSFQEKGGLWAAFLTRGIGYAIPATRYATWNTVQTKWYWDKEQRIRQPLEARGKGLPSNLCNALCAANGAVWVGTTSGLGYGRSLSDWKFLRGRDYEKKNQGLWLESEHKERKARKTAPRHSTAGQDSSLLPEDYITCFYPVPGGMWTGFRESGVCFIQDPSLVIREIKNKEQDANHTPLYVTCFVGLPDGDLYAGSYGQGLIKVGKASVRRTLPQSGQEALAAHPRPPVLSGIPALPDPRVEGEETGGEGDFTACYWYEDWATQGDWCERYGRNYAILCAMNRMGDEAMSLDAKQAYAGSACSGPHLRDGEKVLKYSIIWTNEPDMRNILYCPESTTRTQAQWEDAGDNYPRYFDGPDLGVFVKIPEGRQQLSLYFYDPVATAEKDFNSSLRDYIIEIRKFPADFQGKVAMGQMSPEEAHLPKDYLIRELEKMVSLPVLARSRVKSFSGGGVYKTFILDGQGYYHVRIIRNYSFSATLNGLFLSSLDETNSPFVADTRNTCFWYGSDPPAPPTLNVEDLNKIPGEVLTCWGRSQDVEHLQLKDIVQSRSSGIHAYRHLLQQPGLENLKANWRWKLKLWNKQDKDLFIKHMDVAWRSLQDLYPMYRSSKWASYAPTKTIPFSVQEVQKMHVLKIDWKQYLPDAPVKPERSVEEMKKWLKDH